MCSVALGEVRSPGAGPGVGRKYQLQRELITRDQLRAYVAVGTDVCL